MTVWIVVEEDIEHHENYSVHTSFEEAHEEMERLQGLEGEKRKNGGWSWGATFNVEEFQVGKTGKHRSEEDWQLPDHSVVLSKRSLEEDQETSSDSGSVDVPLLWGTSDTSGPRNPQEQRGSGQVPELGSIVSEMQQALRESPVLRFARQEGVGEIPTVGTEDQEGQAE